MIRTSNIEFDSNGTKIRGLLYTPSNENINGAVVLTGPLTSVKEQATGAYASALAERGFAALSVDHRYFGESDGQPRQYESPPRKIEDIQNALTFLQGHPKTAGKPLVAVGVCAGGGYMAGAVAADARIKAFGAVAGFFHDVEQQKEWMGEEGMRTAIEKAENAKKLFAESGEVQMIPAVGIDGEDVAMPMAEAYEYYGTSRGAIPNYRNEFAVLSRADTLPYDAQHAAKEIQAPTIMVHSENALSPTLARKFYGGLSGQKEIHWLESQGQIDFYDDPVLIGAAADLLAAYFKNAL